MTGLVPMDVCPERVGRWLACLCRRRFFLQAFKCLKGDVSVLSDFLTVFQEGFLWQGRGKKEQD